MLAEFKAKAGEIFINTINARIILRETKKRMLLIEEPTAKDIDEADKQARYSNLVVKWSKKLGFDPANTTIKEVSEYYIHGVCLRHGDKKVILSHEMCQIGQPKSKLLANKNLQGEICQELQFLHEMLNSTKVSKFIAHAARLLIKPTNETIEAKTIALIDDFLSGERNFTCKVK